MSLPLNRSQLHFLLQLLLLGLLVGLACWPLNLVDHAQELLLQALPNFAGGAWTLQGLAIALAPVLVMPALLWLQAGSWARGAGSGIPQTIESLEDPEQAAALMAPFATVARLCLWSAASLALLPLGREGPVVQLGAAVAYRLRQRFPRLLAKLSTQSLMAIGAGAGLAGGFNSPLMGAVFVMEELTGSFQTAVLWPAVVVCSAAALVSNLAGTPLFTLGMVQTTQPEWQQLLWALPVGVGGGLLGGLFSRILWRSSALLRLRVRQRPLAWGLGLGLALGLIAVASGGWSGGDGEALMAQLLEGRGSLPVPGSPLSVIGWLLLVAARLVAPILALAAGIPGGLIDPAFAIGALFGSGSLELLGGSSQLGLALGMAAALAGATQLPLMTVLFALRMAGDQQWLFGILLSAVVGAYVGRQIQPEPIYHALWNLGQSGDQSAPRR
ncbi:MULTISPECIES: chloride channel protein [unclassified Cyanobium]|uniref:chloride channel protein n=1 Tax=unclassified Cyanobium TaxID=2627006 RepID=UPI0020CD7F04|nr:MULTISPECIES: chloride channel protein [unclassified Cyanobium]MCP9777583.1 chloride channel protein [Cyanobium sp. Tous-M-B4]MCP9875493.1 chloride channel protein [Cyanobium sp. A2C-AMD]